MTRAGEPLEFTRYAVAHTGDDCLIWPFARDRHGYGVVHEDGKAKRAHRVICGLAYGPPPSERHVAAHSCGKGHLGCCGANHLRWASISENERDKVSHGTSNRGSRNGRSRLSEAGVLEIAQRADAGERPKDLAAVFHVGYDAVIQIVSGRNWGWLTGRGALHG